MRIVTKFPKKLHPPVSLIMFAQVPSIIKHNDTEHSTVFFKLVVYFIPTAYSTKGGEKGCSYIQGKEQ